MGVIHYWTPVEFNGSGSVFLGIGFGFSKDKYFHSVIGKKKKLPDIGFWRGPFGFFKDWFFWFPGYWNV
jgi:hypothetical protein